MKLIRYHKYGELHAPATRTMGDVIFKRHPSICERPEVEPYEIVEGSAKDITCSRCLHRLGIRKIARKPKETPAAVGASA